MMMDSEDNNSNDTTTDSFLLGNTTTTSTRHHNVGSNSNSNNNNIIAGHSHQQHELHTSNNDVDPLLVTSFDDDDHHHHVLNSNNSNNITMMNHRHHLHHRSNSGSNNIKYDLINDDLTNHDINNNNNEHHRYKRRSSSINNNNNNNNNNTSLQPINRWMKRRQQHLQQLPAIGYSPIQHHSDLNSNNHHRQQQQHYLNNQRILKWFYQQYYILQQYGIYDIIAGIMVGIMIVPQSMSYAKLAGLSVEYGLYSSFIPIYTYALYGIVILPCCCCCVCSNSSRRNTSHEQQLYSILAIGPVALISLMLNSGLSQIMISKNISPSTSSNSNNNDSNNDLYTTTYEQLAMQCTMIVGILCILFGTIQYKSYTIGTIITQCLSHTVISGFTSGASIIISLSQMKYILGYSNIPSGDTVLKLIYILCTNYNQFHLPTFCMGSISLGILLLSKYISNHIKNIKSINLNTIVWYQRIITIIPLLVTILAVICTILFQLQHHYHIKIVGTIPRGLPHSTITTILSISSYYDILQLIPIAFYITIIGFMETIAIAKQLKSKQRVQQQQQQVEQQQQQQQQMEQQEEDGDDSNNNNTDEIQVAYISDPNEIITTTTSANTINNSNNNNNNASTMNHHDTSHMTKMNHNNDVDISQELIGLGLSNILGSIFHSYPVAGSFSRSAINYSTGAQTRYSGLITACIVGMALLILTPFFEQLPYNTLAAIVISGVIGLFDYKEVIALYNVDIIDCMVWCISCGSTMCFGCEYGLLFGIIASFLAVIYKTTVSPIIVLGQVPGTTQYCNIQLHPEAKQLDDIFIIRLGGPLYFANIQYVERTIQAFIGDNTIGEQEQHNNNNNNNNSNSNHIADGMNRTLYIIIDMSCVVYTDLTALRRFEYLVSSYSNDDDNCTSNTLLMSYNIVRVQFYYTNVSKYVRNQMEVVGLIQKQSDEMLMNTKPPIFTSIHDAVQSCRESTL